MKGFPAIAILLSVALVTIGLPLELYALMTRDRRRMMREIRRNAAQKQWIFRMRRWKGDPTAFELQGQTAGGASWVVKTGGAGASNRGWSVRLAVLFPSLAGNMDFVVLPRDPNDRRMMQIATAAPQALKERLAKWSGLAAAALDFLGAASDKPTGQPGFDALYEVMVQPARVSRAPIDPLLAQKLLQWPAESVQPHSLLAWRDALGLHFETHLPGPANWATVQYALESAEALSLRLPVGETAMVPPSLVDKMIGQLQ